MYIRMSTLQKLCVLALLSINASCTLDAKISSLRENSQAPSEAVDLSIVVKIDSSISPISSSPNITWGSTNETQPNIKFYEVSSGTTPGDDDLMS